MFRKIVLLASLAFTAATDVVDRELEATAEIQSFNKGSFRLCANGRGEYEFIDPNVYNEYDKLYYCDENDRPYGAVVAYATTDCPADDFYFNSKTQEAGGSDPGEFDNRKAVLRTLGCTQQFAFVQAPYKGLYPCDPKYSCSEFGDVYATLFRAFVFADPDVKGFRQCRKRALRGQYRGDAAKFYVAQQCYKKWYNEYTTFAVVRGQPELENPAVFTDVEYFKYNPENTGGYREVYTFNFRGLKQSPY